MKTWMLGLLFGSISGALCAQYEGQPLIQDWDVVPLSIYQGVFKGMSINTLNDPRDSAQQRTLLLNLRDTRLRCPTDTACFLDKAPLQNAEWLVVNGSLFTGELVGFNNPKQERIMLRARYENGRLVDSSTVQLAANRPPKTIARRNPRMHSKLALSLFLAQAKAIRNPRPAPKPTPDPIRPANSGPTLVKKPMLYLYPTQETEISVRVEPQNGARLTHTYPRYTPEAGWSVRARPDGTIFANGKEFYALYWEAEMPQPTQISEGFVVRSQDVIPFLEEKLAILGLNPRESNEFIVYWLPILEQNRYNLIHFATQTYAAEFPLRIQPAPDTQIRVLMYFRGLQHPVVIRQQALQPVARKGFTIVEWGGCQLDAPKIKVQ